MFTLVLVSDNFLLTSQLSDDVKEAFKKHFPILLAGVGESGVGHWEPVHRRGLSSLCLGCLRDLRLLAFLLPCEKAVGLSSSLGSSKELQSPRFSESMMLFHFFKMWSVSVWAVVPGLVTNLGLSEPVVKSKSTTSWPTSH